MSKELESMTTAELMAEADKLIQQIHSEFSEDLIDTHRQQLDKHTQDLQNIKAEVRDNMGKKGDSEPGAMTEGMHEAILDIVRAFRQFGKHDS